MITATADIAFCHEATIERAAIVEIGLIVAVGSAVRKRG